MIRLTSFKIPPKLRFYFAVLFVSTVLGIGVTTYFHDSEIVRLDWRADYRALTQKQFIARWHPAFFEVVKKHCNKSLQCAWQKRHGQVDSFSEFYDFQGCSADTEFFPHLAEQGINCNYELRSLSRKGGVLWP